MSVVGGSSRPLASATDSVTTVPSGTQTVSGTVTANAGTGTMAVSAAALPLPTGAAQDGTDSSDANATQATAGVGVRGWLSTLVSLFRAGTAKVGLSAGTALIGKVGIDQTTPGTTNAVAQAAQKSSTIVLQGSGVTGASDLAHGATANGAGTPDSADGYETLILLIDNGAGTCTINVEGSADSAFTNTQQTALLGVVLSSTTTQAGTQTPNISRSPVSGAIAVAANTSYVYSILDPMAAIRARISGAVSLGAGTAATGCTIRLYKIAV